MAGGHLTKYSAEILKIAQQYLASCQPYAMKPPLSWRLLTVPYMLRAEVTVGDKGCATLKALNNGSTPVCDSGT